VPDDMLRLFQQFMGAKKPFNAFVEQGWHPPTDVFETDASMVVVIEVAGIKPSDTNIEVTPAALHINGERFDHHRED